MIIKKGIVFLVCCFFIRALCFSQEILKLEDYIVLVEQNNSELKAIDLSIQAMGQKILELDMVYSPFLSSGYNFSDDRGGSDFGSTLNYNQIVSHSLSIEAVKKFLTGTTVSCGYSTSKATFDLIDPLQIGNDNLYSFSGYDMRPFVRFEQSLLRDFKSGITMSGIKKAKAGIKSAQYMQIYKKQNILFEAKSAYWALSLAREILLFRNASLQRTEQLLKWNEKRFNLDLVEKSDLLQSQVGCKLRELNCQLAEEEVIKASRKFNELIGKSSDAVDEGLEKFSDKLNIYSNIDSLDKSGVRADVLSAKASYESSVFANKETYYRSLPEIKAYGQYSLHGLDFNYSDAWKQTAGFDNPTYSLGLSFIVPLDYKTLFKVREGYKKDFLSAEKILKQVELTSKNDWENIVKTWSNVRKRLVLAKEIKQIQEKRVINEQRMFEKGRTTTFLLLNAENDFDEAVLNEYRLIYEQLIIFAQSEMYNTKEIGE